MKTHLPYAYKPENEFHHPFDGWLLMERSVVYDSWLSWRHVLPRGQRDCSAMTAEVNQAITSLAGGIHQVHQRTPGYRDLGESPFQVLRWWDPHGGPPWSSGSACLFWVSGYSSDEFIAFWSAAASPVSLSADSDLHILATLNPVRAVAPVGPLPGGEPAQSPDAPRTRRSPPPGIPDHAHQPVPIEP